MAEIRSFKNGRRIRTHEDDYEEIEKDDYTDVEGKIRRHKLSRIYRIGVGIFLIAAIVVITIVYQATRSYSGYTITAESGWADNAAIGIYSLGDNLLTYNKDGVVCTDSKGNMVWNQTFQMQNPIISVSGSYAAIGDYNGTVVYILGADGLQGTVSMTLPLKALRVSARGTVVAIVDDAPTTWVYMYSQAGQLLLGAKTSMADYGYPLDLAISADSKLLMISYLFASGGELTTRVAFYNLQDVGDNYQDNLVSAFSYEDAVVPMVRFFAGGSSFAVADNRLMFYGGGEIPTGTREQILMENVRDVVYGDSYVGLVYLNTEGGGKYRMEVYNTAGTRVHNYYFDRDYVDILFANDLVYVYDGGGCDIYNMKGEVKFSGVFEEEIERLIPGSSKEKLLLITKRKLLNAVLK